MIRFFKVISILSSIIFFNSAYCQQSTKIVVIGNVIDRINYAPIHLVNVINTKDKQGASTTKSGFFILNLPRKKSVLRFSHINYRVDSLEITKLQFKDKDTLFLSLTLQPKRTELKTVQIVSDQSIDLAYQKRGIIIDYEFIGDDVLFLLKIGKSFKLALVDDQDNVITEELVAFKNVRLVKDCFNNIHIINENVAIQVVLKDRKLSFIINSIKDYNKYLEPCIISTNDKLFLYQSPSRHNQQLLYFTINKTTKQKELFLTIYDQLADQYARGLYYQIIATYNATTEPVDNIILAGVWRGNPIKLFKKSTMNLINEYKHLAAVPIYCPLKQINESILVFDHVNDSLFTYNFNGQIEKSIFIDYHYPKEWAKEIIVDERQNYAYAKFYKNGITSLKKIDLKSGLVTKTYRLDHHVFLEKIKVKGDYIYYLHKDINALNTGIYKQPLKEL